MRFGFISTSLALLRPTRTPHIYCASRVGSSASEEGESVLQRIPKNSHRDFFENRNWDCVSNFWTRAVTTLPSNLPAFVRGGGDEEFGIMNLQEICDVGRVEFSSKDVRYQKKKNYALRIGYDGKCFKGYQRQKDLNASATVEGDPDPYPNPN